MYLILTVDMLMWDLDELMWDYAVKNVNVYLQKI